MDKLLATLTQYLSAAQETLSKYAPQVWAATLHLIQIRGIMGLSARVIVIVVIISTITWLRKVQKPKFPKASTYGCDQMDIEIMAVVFTILGTIISVGLTLTSFNNVLAAGWPQLYVLQQLADKAGIL